MISLFFRDVTQNIQVTPVEIKLDAAKIKIEYEEEKHVYYLELQDLYVLRRSAQFLDDNIVWDVLVTVPTLGLTFTGRIGIEDRKLIDDDYYAVNIRLDPLDYVGKYLESAIVTKDELGNLAVQIDVAYESDQLTMQRMLADTFTTANNILFSLLEAALGHMRDAYRATQTAGGFGALSYSVSVTLGAPFLPLLISFLYATEAGLQPFITTMAITRASFFVINIINLINIVNVYTKFIKSRKQIKFFAINMYDLLTFVLTKNDIAYDANSLSFLRKYHVVTHKRYFRIFPVLQFIRALNKIYYFYNTNGRFHFACVDLDAIQYFPKEYAREKTRESFDYVAYKKVSFSEQKTNIFDSRQEYNFTTNFAYTPTSYQRIIYPALGSKNIDINYALGRRKNDLTVYDKLIITQIAAIIFTIAAIIIAGYVIFNVYEQVQAAFTFFAAAISFPPISPYFAIQRAYQIAQYIALAVMLALVAVLVGVVIAFLTSYKAGKELLQIENLATDELVCIFDDIKKSKVKKDCDTEILNDIRNRNQDVFIKILYSETNIPFSQNDWNTVQQGLWGIQSLVYYFRDERADITSFRVVPVNKSRLEIKEYFP